MGIALYDRLDREPPKDPHLTQLMWRRREIENYLCRRETLLNFAASEDNRHAGEIFAEDGRTKMAESIAEIEQALQTLGESSPWGQDIKASDDFLDPVFKRFYEKLGIPNLMTKTNYHRLAGFVAPEHIDAEVKEKLDAIVAVAERARPQGG